MIVFCAVYLCVLVCYLFSETSGNFRRRAWNKILLAVMYLACAWALFLNRGQWNVALVLMAGLCLTFAGDVWLLWSFVKGGACFAMANVCILAYEICLIVSARASFSQLWWACIPFALLWGGFLLLCRVGFLRLPAKLRAVRAYLASVTAGGCLGLALACAIPCKETALLGVGLFLFAVSDYFLMLHKFKYRNKKWVLRCNSLTYFTGILLVALSIGA